MKSNQSKIFQNKIKNNNKIMTKRHTVCSVNNMDTIPIVIDRERDDDNNSPLKLVNGN